MANENEQRETNVIPMAKKGVITLRYHQMRSPHLLQALRVLKSAPLLMRVTHKLYKLCSKIDREMAESGQIYLKLVKEHCEVLENGSPKINEKGHLVFLSPEKEAAFKKAYAEFLMLEVEFPRMEKFTVKDLEEAKLSMEQLEPLLPILDEDVV